MPSKSSTLVILFVMLLILSGCNDTILPAHRISASASNATEAAIAVDGQGAKNLLTVECPKRGFPLPPCGLVYRYVKGYEAPVVFAWEAASGKSQRYPDIAVDNEGGVYLVWQECDTGYTNCVDYYAFGSRFGFPVVARLDPTRYSSGPPVIAARGPDVYAVYEVPDGSGTALRYRQLSPLNHSSGWVSDHPADALQRRQPSLTITADGTLYVAWNSTWPGGARIMSNNNYGVTGDMPSQLGTSSGNFLAPSAAVDSDDQYFIFTWVENLASTDPFSDAVWIAWCTISNHNCATSGGMTKLDLPPAKHWDVWNGGPKPALVTNADNAYLAFSAMNDDTGGGYEIFRLAWPPGTLTPAPTQVSDNGLVNGQPFIEMVNGFDVIVWRTDGFPPTHGDIFWSRFPFSEINTVRQAQSWNGRDGADVDSNGIDMAGVWLEMHEYSYGEQDEAWMTFNGYAAFLPLLTAP